MRIKALWRKYRRKIYKVADWLLYISGGFSALLLLWIVLQVTTVAHFVVPTGSMEPTLIPGDRILVNKWLMGARIFDVWESAANIENNKQHLNELNVFPVPDGDTGTRSEEHTV